MSHNYLPRWIIVDDIDPRIQYHGPGWFQDQGSQDNKGNFGPSYGSTLHGTNVDGSLSFAFSGLRVNVTGSNDGVQGVEWECFIDGVNIGRYPFSPYPENDYRFCITEEDLVDGPHVITLNATVAMGQTFWFDSIKYVPSPNIPLDGEAILVDNVDSAMHFGEGWVPFGDIANLTNTTNSNMSFSFLGTSVTWYGITPGNYPNVSSLGRYSVDGGDSTNFPLKAPNSTTTIYVVKYFETPAYPPGLHEIVVTFLGSQDTTPLLLNHVVVQNGTLPTTSTVTGPTSIASGSTRPTAGTPIHHSSKTGMISGSVVGGALVVLLAIALLCLSRWRKKGIDGHESTMSEIMVVERFRSRPTLQRRDGTDPKFTQNTTAGMLLQDSTTPRVAMKFNSNTPSRPEPFSEGVSSANTQSHRRQLATPATPHPSNTGGSHVQPGTNVPPRVIHHEDSGVRLPEVVSEPEVVEVPPVYTVV